MIRLSIWNFPDGIRGVAAEWEAITEKIRMRLFPMQKAL